MPSVLNKLSSLPVLSALETLLELVKCFLDISAGFIRPVNVVPETFKAAIFRSRLESCKYCSVSTST